MIRIVVDLYHEETEAELNYDKLGAYEFNSHLRLLARQQMRYE